MIIPRGEIQLALVGNFLLHSTLRRRLAVLLFIGWNCVWSGIVRAVEWPTLGLNEAVTNRFVSPTTITHAGDGSQRLFIAQRDGRVWIIKDGRVLPEPFLDLSSQLTAEGFEQGLLGLAFPPHFAESQRFYAYYTMATNPPFAQKQTLLVLSRFQVSFNPDLAALRAEEKLIVLQKSENYHNGGQLAFGPDGFLYVGIGDGGPQGDRENRAQDLKSLFGKILRIDVERGGSGYAIPPTNPFVGNINALPEIWAYGLRNPWRFSFDRATGDLYIGDVGQGAFEEVDFQPGGSAGGQNYGWRVKEGPANFNVSGFTNFGSLTPPILSYDHGPLGGDGGQGSVTGGYVYRGPNPGRLADLYVYADFMAGYIWGLRNVDGQWRTNALRTPFDGPVIGISSFGEDEAGRLYAADYNRGIIYQITDSGKSWAPEFSPRDTFIPSERLLITSQTAGAEIRYTLDGSEPDLSSPTVPEDGHILVLDGATVKARAFHNELKPSDIRTATFKYRTGTPIFTPGPNATVLSNTLVTLRCETPNATIYYATNWYTGQLGEVYKGPIPVTGGLMLEARAIAPGFATSEVSYARITLASAPFPRIDPPGGYVTNGTPITITCDHPEATLSYRILRETSATPSRPYTAPLKLDGRMTVWATATLPGHLPTEHAIEFFPSTAKPVFDPPAGAEFANQFTISSGTPGATIWYTLEPYGNGGWKVYAAPVIITNSVQVRARAYGPGLEASPEETSYYPWPRVGWLHFEPGAGPVTNEATVAIKSHYSELGLVIRYTLDGSEPNNNSPIYTGPIRVTPPVTLKAAGEAPGYLPGYPENTVTNFYGATDFERVFVSTYAGSTNAGYADGPRHQARFWEPSGICIDPNGNLYVLDSGNSRVRKITPEGSVTTIGWGFDYGAGGICIDPEGNVFVADTRNCNTILKFSAEGGSSVFANVSYCQPSHAPPFYITGLASAADGSLVVGVDEDRLIRVTPAGFENIAVVPRENSHWFATVSPIVERGTNIFFATGTRVFRMNTAGAAELLAGGRNGITDGPIASAGFQTIYSIATDGAGGLLIGDGPRLRRIRDGMVTTVAGAQRPFGDSNYRNGPGNAASLSVGGICADANGIIYVADPANNCIRKIEPDTAGVGLPDSWQTAMFGEVGISPDADPDGDGVSNAGEYWAGTNPTNAGSHFIVAAEVNANGALEIRWTTAVNKMYQAQVSTDLMTWTDLGPAAAGTGSPATVSDATLAYRNAHWFYRVLITNN